LKELFHLKDAQEFLRCFMDELHSEMRIVQSYPDDKYRSESSSTESSEIPIITSKYVLFYLHYEFRRTNMSF